MPHLTTRQRSGCPPDHRAGLAASNREGRRKIREGGVHLGDERVTDPSLEVAPGDVDGRLLRLGRRSWARLRAR